MTVILFCTIVGFLVGLYFVIVQRKLNIGKILAAALLGFLSAEIIKEFKDYHKNKKYY